MAGKPWTEQEIDILRQQYPCVRAASLVDMLPGRTAGTIQNKAWSLGIKKTPETIARLSHEAMLNKHHGGRKHLFRADQTPWNKGQAFDPGGRSAETRFKPGQRPRNWRPIGHVRVTRDGYHERKIQDTGQKRHDYVGLHTLLWREAGKDVPPGHVLVFRDGDKNHIALDNLELITRAELMKRNSVHNLPKEVAELVQLRGALVRQINKRTGKNEQ